MTDDFMRGFVRMRAGDIRRGTRLYLDAKTAARQKWYDEVYLPYVEQIKGMSRLRKWWLTVVTDHSMRSLDYENLRKKGLAAACWAAYTYDIRPRPPGINSDMEEWNSNVEHFHDDYEVLINIEDAAAVKSWLADEESSK